MDFTTSPHRSAAAPWSTLTKLALHHVGLTLDVPPLSSATADDRLTTMNGISSGGRLAQAVPPTRREVGLPARYKLVTSPVCKCHFE